jgi:hypothetical protein
MLRTFGKRVRSGLAFTVAGILLTTLGGSWSPGGAGSISVPSGKDKLKVASGIGSVNPKAASKTGSVKPKGGSTRPSQPGSRRE